MAYEEWAGASGRDLVLDDWFTRQLVAANGRRHQRDVHVLLGGRGSGKTSLLAAFEERAANTYVAHVDCAGLPDGVRDPADVLARIAFQLSAEVPGLPPMQLPAYAALRLALAVRTDQADRDAALTELSAALDAGRGREQSLDLFLSLAEKLGSLAGMPAWGLAALPFLSEGMRRLQEHRVRRALARHVNAPASPEDFLVGLSHGLQHGDERQRRRAQEVLLRAFLDDLRRAYDTAKGSELRTLRCLLLLDNADDDRGQAFLDTLRTARRGGPEDGDPLVVVAAARSRPRLVEPLDVPAGRLLTCWSTYAERAPEPDPYGGGEEERFEPLEVRGKPHVRVAQLRPLSRAEVAEQCRPLLAELPPPGVRRPAEWLARIVHDLTGGQPFATAAVLRQLPLFEDELSIVDRLRKMFTLDPHRPSVAEEAYERCFGDVPGAVRTRLPRVAAAAVPVQALAADALWGRQNHLLYQVTELIGDELRFDVTDLDGGSVLTVPPIARRHLLQRLARSEDGAEAGTWAGAHRRLRDAMRGRDAAYHHLALGDVPAATRYLHGLLEDVKDGGVDMAEWCRALSWVQRAPHPRLTAPDDGMEEYEAAVERLGNRVPAGQLPVARLLIAGRLTVHPPTDPYAALWSDPLWDPTARLRTEIAEQLQQIGEDVPHLRGLPLHQRIQSYDKEPW
ncbi:hypothetical protein [Streptomyces cavernicola]|uniref:Orc1-like AAA ATPase domain-containing protein n=1 Tax=Streptomyces cavernicola TaxID=3043613 RepID=A0ABT6SBK0_9ACTN|nr:hypothetical protein [Streptomyces sp. B-S-A6]MDI3405022.1 hypothetical protein [Streptomyces sp. B-S-A6]